MIEVTGFDKLHDELKGRWKVHSAADVRNAWQSNTELNHIYLMLMDDEYHALSMADWSKVLALLDTRKHAYTHHYWDCNSFAILAKAEVSMTLVNSMGIVLNVGGRHAFNSMLVDTDGKLSYAFAEPQIDKPIALGSRPCYTFSSNGMCLL